MLGNWARSYLCFFILISQSVALGMLLAIPSPILVATFLAPLAFYGLERWAGERHPGRLLAAHLGFTGAVVAVCSQIGDYSSDGATYHSAGVYFMSHGWNTVWQTIPANVHGLYIDCYPKAVWYVGAVVHYWTGLLKAAKFQEPVFAVCSFFILLDIFKRWLSVSAIGRRVGIALALTLNPVVLAQLFANASDGVVYYCFLLTTLWAGKFLYGKWVRQDAVFFFLVLSFFVNLKFTALVYAVMGFGMAGIWVLATPTLRGRFIPFVRLATAPILTGFLVFGASPYITNTLKYGFPLHPAMGPKRIPFLEWFIDVGFVNRPPLSRFFVSLFGFTSNAGASTDLTRSSLWLKYPFTLGPGELVSLTVFDTRLGGFGPWFSVLFLLSVVLLARMTWRYRWQTGPLWLGYAFLLVCSSLNEGSFWARYAPQWWLVILAPLAFQLLREQKMAALSVAMLLVTAVNLYLVVRPNWGNHLRLRELETAQIRAISKLADGKIQVTHSEEPLVLYEFLKEYGLSPSVVTLTECREPAHWVSQRLLMFCRPPGVTDAQWEPIRQYDPQGDPTRYITELIAHDPILAPLFGLFASPRWMAYFPARQVQLIQPDKYLK